MALLLRGSLYLLYVVKKTDRFVVVGLMTLSNACRWAELSRIPSSPFGPRPALRSNSCFTASTPPIQPKLGQTESIIQRVLV